MNKKKKKITAVHETAAQKNFCSLSESNYAETLKYLPCAKKNIGWDCSLNQRGNFPTIGKMGGRKKKCK